MHRTAVPPGRRGCDSVIPRDGFRPLRQLPGTPYRTTSGWSVGRDAFGHRVAYAHLAEAYDGDPALSPSATADAQRPSISTSTSVVWFSTLCHQRFRSACPGTTTRSEPQPAYMTGSSAVLPLTTPRVRRPTSPDPRTWRAGPASR